MVCVAHLYHMRQVLVTHLTGLKASGSALSWKPPVANTHKDVTRRINPFSSGDWQVLLHQYCMQQLHLIKITFFICSPTKKNPKPQNICFVKHLQLTMNDVVQIYYLLHQGLQTDLILLCLDHQKGSYQSWPGLAPLRPEN